MNRANPDSHINMSEFAGQLPGYPYALLQGSQKPKKSCTKKQYNKEKTRAHNKQVRRERKRQKNK